MYYKTVNSLTCLSFKTLYLSSKISEFVFLLNITLTYCFAVSTNRIYVNSFHTVHTIHQIPKNLKCLIVMLIGFQD